VGDPPIPAYLKRASVYQRKSVLGKWGYRPFEKADGPPALGPLGSVSDKAVSVLGRR